MTILHISDIHYKSKYSRSTPYLTILSQMISPLKKLRTCIRAAQDNDDIDIIVISGDLTEYGSTNDYAELKNQIDALSGNLPTIVAMGNHDHRANFRRGWLNDLSTDNAYHKITTFSGVDFISLDSSNPQYPDGIFTTKTIQWLNQALSAHANRPAVLILHHQIVDQCVGIPVAKGLNQLKKALNNSRVIAILGGHTHHCCSLKFANIPYHTVNSLSFIGHGTANQYVEFKDTYGYAVHQIENGMLTNSQTFTYSSNRIIGTIKF